MAAALGVATAATWMSAQPAAAGSRCVSLRATCFASLKGALAASRDGDVIHLPRGTFAGGVTIAKSVTLKGAGVGATVIRGGGPVVTIGTFGAQTEPTVTVVGVTITGGRTTSSPIGGFLALGGGIYVPESADSGPGATVTIRRSLITGNHAQPATTIPSGLSCGGGVICRFAAARGGGVYDAGRLRMIDSAVIGNRAGPAAASDAEGGGIFLAGPGTLAMTDSLVARNTATATAPNGRFADGGGLFAFGPVKIAGGSVTGNHARLTTAMSNDVESGTAAASGGVHAIGPAQLRGVRVSGNTATAVNRSGDAVAFCAGVCADGDISVRGSRITGNTVTAGAPLQTGNNASADSGALGIGDQSTATISSSVLSHNGVRARAGAGSATASAGAVGTAGAGHLTTIEHTAITDNRATARSVTGRVQVQGVGINNGGALTVRHTTISANFGRATGPAGSAEGGGIWNGRFDPALNPTLTISHSSIVGNSLFPTAGVTARGGGLFTTVPVRLRSTELVGNTPDQCVGC